MGNKQEVKQTSSYMYCVCIERAGIECFTGKVYPSDGEDTIIFSSFADFIIKMDKYMDQHGPQSSQDKRSLTEERNVSRFVLPKDTGTYSSPLMDLFNFEHTYLICMFSRRNTEWQGAIYHKGSLQLEFSNILDLTTFFSKSIISSL